MENTYDNNIAVLYGVISTVASHSHDLYGEGFYSFKVSVERLSNCFDEIPVIISERLFSPAEIKPGRKIFLNGQFRSYNDVSEGNKRHLVLTFFAREVKLDIDYDGNTNTVEFDGFVCKPIIYRTTPSGREISDILLAVNRSYSKSDYIPCIVWGRNARYCVNLSVGTRLRIFGRMQSRKYNKRLPDGTSEERTAYEVSVSKFTVLKNADNNNDNSENESGLDGIKEM